ncbi:MAG: hypothetical protein HGB11_03075 [Chlorobiales bacterium]|nr:hypothetical protein [Chlorobiales bacterium]
MKLYVAGLVAGLCLYGGAVAFGGESLFGIAGKDLQKKPAKAPAQVQDQPKVDPRELIARDSLKALQKWLDTEKEYRMIREQIRQQDEQILILKERKEKAEKVQEVYNSTDTKEPAQAEEQKESEKNLREAAKGYEVSVKDLDKLKEKMVVAEKRYNVAERAYKIYNPSLSGVAGLQLRKSMGDTTAIVPEGMGKSK